MLFVVDQVESGQPLCAVQARLESCRVQVAHGGHALQRQLRADESVVPRREHPPQVRLPGVHSQCRDHTRPHSLHDQVQPDESQLSSGRPVSMQQLNVRTIYKWFYFKNLSFQKNLVNFFCRWQIRPERDCHIEHRIRPNPARAHLHHTADVASPPHQGLLRVPARHQRQHRQCRELVEQRRRRRQWHRRVASVSRRALGLGQRRRRRPPACQHIGDASVQRESQLPSPQSGCHGQQCKQPQQQHSLAHARSRESNALASQRYCCCYRHCHAKCVGQRAAHNVIHLQQWHARAQQQQQQQPQQQQQCQSSSQHNSAVKLRIDAELSEPPPGQDESCQRVRAQHRALHDAAIRAAASTTATATAAAAAHQR